MVREGSSRLRFFVFSFLVIILLTLGWIAKPVYLKSSPVQSQTTQTLSNSPVRKIHGQLKQSNGTLIATDRGIFLSSNNQWQQLTKEEAFALAQSSDKIFAGTRRGLLISSDNGRSWQESNLGITQGAVPLTIEVSQSGNSIYLGTDRNGIFKSNDQGASWHLASEGLPPAIGVNPVAAIKRLAISPLDQELIFAGTDAQGLYLSRDGGSSWQAAKLNLPGIFHHRVNAPLIAFDSNAPNKIFTLVTFPVHSHLDELFIYSSNDRGKSWQLLGKAEPNQLVTSFTVANGIARILTDQGEKEIDLAKLSLAKKEENFVTDAAAVVLPGTESDYDVDNIAILHDDNNFTNPAIGDLRDGGSRIAKRFYQRHGDDYDILVTFGDPTYVFQIAGGSFAYNIPLVNNVAGIGVQVGTYNGGPATFGSNNFRLRAFCNFNNIAYYNPDPNGNTLGTNSTYDVMSHEIGHLWSAYFHFNDNGVTSDELLGRQLAHWNFFFNSNASFMEGNGYDDIGNSQFRIRETTSRFNDFDLYAMGYSNGASSFLIQNPTNIDPPLMVNNQVLDPKDPALRTLPPIGPPQFPTLTITGTRRDISLADIVAVEGPRVVGDSTGPLKIGFIYIVPPGREPMDESLEQVKNLRRNFISFFSNATRGNGFDGTLNAVGGTDNKAPTLNISSPNGGETLFAGTPATVTWDVADENGIANQEIALSLDGGSTYSVLASKLNGKTTSLNFEVPVNSFSSTAKLKITAFDYAGNKVSDVSDNIFIIKPETAAPTVNVKSPNGDELILAGKNYEITWDAIDNGEIGSHEITLSVDGGKSFNIPIVSGLNGRVFRFVWQVPDNLIADDARIQVTSIDKSGNRGTDSSDKSFRITKPDVTPPQVTLLSPSAGEKLQAGGTFNITWNSSDNDRVASHELRLSTDGGNSFSSIIASGLSGSAQSFTWQVPDIEITTARVRITATDSQGNSVFDVSDNNSSITRQDVTAPTVKVINPNGGDIVRAGEMLNIGWQSSDKAGIQSQRIRLSVDGGKTFAITIVEGLPGTANSFNFLVPDTLLTNNARVEVSALDINGNLGSDSSDADFAVTAKDKEAPKITVLTPNGSEILASDTPLRVTWQSSDNNAVVGHDVQISVDGGQSYSTLQAGLIGTVQEAVVDVSRFASESAKIKIIARDAAGNISSDDSNNTFVLAVRPNITNAQFKDSAGKLTIFATGVSGATTVEINGQAINTPVKFKAAQGSLVLKGNAKALNIASGENTVVVKERGIVSQAFKFTF